LREISGVALSENTFMRRAYAAGRLALLEQDLAVTRLAAAPLAAPPTLCVMLDGTGVPCVAKDTRGRKGKDGRPAKTRESYALTLQLDHNEALADTMTLRLVDSANTKAKLNLNFSGKERVLALTINGVSQPNETFGGTGSGAQNIDATRFSGSGMLIVGPPPPACTAIVIR
jgi:hypothetical protein